MLGRKRERESLANNPGQPSITTWKPMNQQSDPPNLTNYPIGYATSSRNEYDRDWTITPGIGSTHAALPLHFQFENFMPKI